VGLWLGPTASGKSDAALAVAERFGAEIVSLDSALVYRGMDIGTAKPPGVVRERVPHHLIDLIDPDESYSVARFADDCRRALASIAARGRPALIVGGTMMYADVLLNGMSAVPPTDPDVRRALLDELRAEGLPALHARLAKVDPVLAARLPVGDRQRILRGLEVHRMTGTPLSSLQGRRRSLLPGWRFEPLLWTPLDRAWLHARCAGRLQAMWQAGFVEEVATLRDRFRLTPAHASMRAVGYRQVLAGLVAAESGEAIRDRALFATRQLAKRQTTWLRTLARQGVTTQIACDAADALSRAIDWFGRIADE